MSFQLDVDIDYSAPCNWKIKELAGIDQLSIWNSSIGNEQSEAGAEV